MAYIGRDPLYGLFEKQEVAPNGVDSSFDLDYFVGSASSLLVVQNGSIRNPEVDYSITNGGKTIQFSSAPNANFYIVYLGKQYLVPNFGKRFIVNDLNDNLTLNQAELPDIISLNPISAARTVFIPLASDVAGYQLVVRNRSTTQDLIVNAGTNIATVLPNTQVTIVSDSLSWFIV